ncbi:MAG TPA: serine/threonine-protein kinase [Polyangiaceae bacterium]|jgi:serine/threonine-protein kinase
MARATPLIPPPQTDIPLGDGRSVRIGAQVGRGSMATVYRGVYESGFALTRTVAVKVFDVIASDEHDAVLASLASASRRSACVRHPNVVRVEDFGLLGPAQPYAIEELVEGRTLSTLMAQCARRRERVTLDLALFLGIEIAEALAGARLASSPEGVRLGVVHGELSTSDVLLSWQGEVKVSDFAVAAAARAASMVRSVRGLARRVRALAPEVARGQIGDARSDVFSLGVILREMLVGPRFPPFVSDSEALAWAREGIVHQSMFEPHLPPPLHALLARSLERDPMRRYPHAGALGYDLRRVALTMGVGDGRWVLRNALARAFGEAGADDEDEVTGEMRLPRPSGVVDRFARLRGDGLDSDGVPAAMESGTVAIGCAVDRDDDDAEEA